MHQLEIKNELYALCPTCNKNTVPHYLNNKLLISYCDCQQTGGIYVGLTNKPYWKLYEKIDRDSFYELANSASLFVSVMRELNDAA